MKMIREVTDGVWLNVKEISEVIVPDKAKGPWAGDGDALIICMTNGNSYGVPHREGATPETMIRNLFTGGHE